MQYALSIFSLVFPALLMTSTTTAKQPLQTAAQPAAHSLSVGENFVDPLGFYDPSPVLSWKLPVADEVKSQSAYQVVVTDAPSASDDANVIWDSGKVESDQSVWVDYQGPPLQSRARVFWTVKFWDQDGRPSPLSDEASLEMGLLNKSDFTGQWIEFERPVVTDTPVKIFKAEFGNRDGDAPQVKDVTKGLQKAMNEGGKPVRVVSKRFGGDPAPGKPKSLWVEYEFNGKKKSKTIKENGRFNPYPPVKAQPGYYLRRQFKTKPKIVSARLYASALGIYKFYINGQPVGDDVLSPGYTSYDKRVETLTYDVTDLIREGDNGIGALLGEGWYAGRLLLRSRGELLNLAPKLLGQLELTYDDGTVETVATDASWKCTNDGPIVAGGLYHGEDYDANKELGDFSTAGFDDQNWKTAKATPLNHARALVPKSMPATKVMKTVKAVKLSQPEPGKFVFDFGQNLVGVPKVTLPVKSGETITFRFAEMLQQDGTLYTENYRSARSEATYIAAKDGEITWQPSLSFFGFRHLEISGLSQANLLTTESATAEVYHTQFDSSGTFASSHDKLNQLQSNIRWGQISNFIDVPTDCPQRDERLGWTGDAQVFLPTSFFNYDVYSFWSRWLQTVRDDQNENGEIPHTVPSTNFGYASPGWADVIVTAPWDVYVRTGDIRILQDNYDAMKKWVEVYQRQSDNDGDGRLIPTTSGFGDWLQPYTQSNNRGDTAQALIATAYFGRDAQILWWTAQALGNDEDAATYEKLHADIGAAFSKRYFASEKPAEGANTQTACLMGLAYDLLLPPARPIAVDRLMKKFEEADRHLRTGFLGTPLLAPVFDQLGHPDICFELLFKESYPSWFYSINQGATTMWERWNSYSHADGFGDKGMNSFNHYAYGAIGQFMYERIAGLSPDPANPGYKHFFVRPLIGGPLEFTSATLETPYGTASSGWKKSADGTTIDAVVPPNTTATCILPTDDSQNVRVDGNEILESGLEISEPVDGSLTVNLGPGTYKFEIETTK